MGDNDVLASHRRDVCQFADGRTGPASKVAFVHSILEREAAQARMFLPRLERFAAKLDADTRADPPVAAALQEIAADTASRDRYMDLARDADSAAVRARMVALAGQLGWLTPGEEREELAQMWTEQVARNAITPGGSGPRVQAQCRRPLRRPPAGSGAGGLGPGAGRAGCDPRVPRKHERTRAGAARAHQPRRPATRFMPRPTCAIGRWRRAVSCAT